MKDGHLLPSLFVLLPSKLQETYQNMWTQVKTMCPNACPTHLVVALEKAAINAFEQHYPDTQVKGCFSTLEKQFLAKNTGTWVQKEIPR